MFIGAKYFKYCFMWNKIQFCNLSSKITISYIQSSTTNCMKQLIAHSYFHSSTVIEFVLLLYETVTWVIYLSWAATAF